MKTKIINGKSIAEEINKKSYKDLKILYKKYGVKPNITTIKIGDNPSSNLYLKLRDKLCKEIGIISNHLEYDEDISEKHLIKKIKKLNLDKQIHGIFIQLPIPQHISANNLYNIISPIKDVEGLTPFNLGKTLLGDESIIPCTPQAVLEILNYEKENLKGKDVVIINHSNIVGKPLAILLLNRNATATVCHVYTKNLKRYTTKADILITATGLPKIIKNDFVKEDSFIIDVGISKTEYGITGDVDFESVKDKIKKITPVPGGVGPITISCSIRNMLKTYQKVIESEKKN
jgi:methylenetetrahydrofolate dehydrogenase (NADP+)/methenyltetrahydrofolate cyclohydrolase